MLLTASKPTPRVVGYDQTAFLENVANSNLIVCGGPGLTSATATTTLLSGLVRFGTTEAAVARLVTGTISGTSFTVRAVSAPTSLASGSNAVWTPTISLPVVTGDFIAVYQEGSTKRVVRGRDIGAPAALHYLTTTTIPTAGTIYSGLASLAGYAMCISAS